MVRVGLTVSKIEARLGLRLPVGSGLGQGYKRGRKGRSARGIITLLPRFSLETLHSVFWGGKTGRDFLRWGMDPLHTKFKSEGGSIPPEPVSPTKTECKVSSENRGIEEVGIKRNQKQHRKVKQI